MSVPPLLQLPFELLLKIIGNLQDLEDLLSAALVCRRIFYIFQEAQRPLIESTFAKYLRLNTDRGLYRVLTQLSWIVRRAIVRRDVVCHIFETGWEIFKQKHQEELLIPFGRALAWSYVLDDRRSDAVCLLQLIQNGEPPFGWSMRSLSQLPLQPIRDLLAHLNSEGNGDGTYISSDLKYPLVEFKRKPKRGAIYLNDSEQNDLLKNGILFRENSIVMRMRQPYPMRPYPMRTAAKHMLNYTFYRREPMFNDTMNRDIMETLAHRPTRAYMRGGQYRS